MSRKVEAFIVALALFSVANVRADERVDRLSEAHRSWLERDVLYIIAEREREVFLTLETEEERNRFVEAFWRKRDPNPATSIEKSTIGVAGQFDRAVETARRGLSLPSAAEADPLAREIRSRLELYQQGKAYRQPARAAGAMRSR